MKWLIKLFAPSPKTLSEYAARGIQKAVNESGKQDMIVKYGDLSDKALDVAKWISEIVKDGTIDDIETKDIQNRLEPLFQKVMNLI